MPVMSKTRTASSNPTITVVAVLLLIWHIGLSLDYLNYWFGDDLTRSSEYWGELAAAMDLSAIWAWIGWGLAVLCGLGGSLFLLVRDDAAVLLLFTAAVGALLAVVGDLIGVGLDVALHSSLLLLPRLAMLGLLVLVPALGWVYARARNASGELG